MMATVADAWLLVHDAGVRSFGLVGVVCVGVAVALLSGCTPPVVGVAGVGVDADGELVGYLVVCEQYIDGATLYDTGGFNGGPTLGKWESKQPITDFVSWSLSNPDDGWTVEKALESLSDSRSYAIYGWRNDNEGTATHVSFRLSDLDRLQPGEVLYNQGDRLLTVSEAEFQADACKQR
jgi:hypothetical protein